MMVFYIITLFFNCIKRAKYFFWSITLSQYNKRCHLLILIASFFDFFFFFFVFCVFSPAGFFLSFFFLERCTAESSQLICLFIIKYYYLFLFAMSNTFQNLKSHIFGDLIDTLNISDHIRNITSA